MVILWQKARPHEGNHDGNVGAEALGGAFDDGVMYMRGFRDLDGHQWSFLHLDMSAMPAQ
jgi:predicted lactoylglutathione lyase